VYTNQMQVAYKKRMEVMYTMALSNMSREYLWQQWTDVIFRMQLV